MGDMSDFLQQLTQTIQKAVGQVPGTASGKRQRKAPQEEEENESDL